MTQKRATLDNNRNWRDKTIEELEKQNFGNPDEGPTNLIKRCLQLCRIPLHQFAVEDLRLMIGQEFSLRYLIPLAIEHLNADIFIEGDYFPGDLLKNVLSVSRKFWVENEDLWKEVNELIDDKRDDLMLKKIPTASFDSVFNQ